MDATQPFPFPSGSFDLIFSEHMIEHVPFDQGQKMLRECFRVLKPGGKIRIATPNLQRIAALSTVSPSADQKRYASWAIEHHVPYALRADSPADDYRPAYVINNFFWGFGHYFVYDPRTLAAAMTTAGFVDPVEFDPGVSDTGELRGLETHADLIGEEFNRFETMVLQATQAMSVARSGLVWRLKKLYWGRTDYWGMPAAWRRMKYRTIPSPGLIVVRNSCVYKLHDHDELASESIYVHGTCARYVTLLLQSAKASFKTFIDLGANIGSVTIPVAKGFGGEVLSIRALASKFFAS